MIFMSSWRTHPDGMQRQVCGWMIWFLRGLAIAVIFGLPAGAIGVLTIQRTLKSGFGTGFATGLGSTAADMLYAYMGVFSVTLVSGFLTAHQRVIGAVSGGLKGGMTMKRIL